MMQSQFMRKIKENIRHFSVVHGNVVKINNDSSLILHQIYEMYVHAGIVDSFCFGRMFRSDRS